MSILVCGGAGYIASHFVKKLIKENEDVVVIDALITGHREAVPKNVPFYEFNLLETEKLRDLFKKEKIEAVVHFAASSIVPESMREPLKYFKNNFCATLSLLKVMEEFNVDKLIFSSTAAVYGTVNKDLIDEETKTNPENPYGESKLAMEKMIMWQSKATDLRYCSLRYFNVAGSSLEGEIGEVHNPETHIIPIAINSAINNKTLTVFGDDFDTKDGTCIRDYIHVLDLVNAHYLALNYLREGNKSEIMNLGYSRGFSNLEIVEAVKRVTKTDFKVVIGNRREGDPARLVSSNKKALDILKWKFEYDDIDIIISSAYSFLRSHQNGYE